MVEKVNAREQEIKKGERAGSTIVVADIIWELLDDRLKEALNMQKITCKQSLFLDLTPEKQLDMGKSKNIALGKVREALGLNDKKKDFFLGLLIGNTAKVQVVHEPNEQDPTSPYSKVNRVAPMNS